MNKITKITILISFFALFSFLLFLTGCDSGSKKSSENPESKNRGFRSVNADGSKLDLNKLYSGFYALVIGCADYRNGWNRLRNPVKDAREVAATLKGMGWEVDTLENPNHDTLDKKFNELIAGPGRDREKAVLVWFSGHGHTMKEADGTNLGYIVPVDAPDPAKDEAGFMDKAIDMRRIETVAERIHSKHVLMMFDSCFSGSVFNTVRSKPSAFIEDKVSKMTREFITAGCEDEEVPDVSKFKDCFIQGIRDKYADMNKDGYITGWELGSYLEEKVVNYTNGNQHPHFGKINNPKLDKGDFVFFTQVASLTFPEPKSPTMLNPEKVVSYGSISLDCKLSGTLYLDGKNMGRVKNGYKYPLSNLTAGNHTLKIKTSDDTWSKSINVYKNRETSITAKLASTLKPPGPQKGSAWTVPDVDMEFVWIKELNCWVGKYEVTNGEYRKFKSNHNSDKYEGPTLNKDRQPVVYVNFDDAQEYAKWLTEQERKAGRLPSGYQYRLPTKDEWTAFCQCGDNRKYPWGDNWPPKSGKAGNYSGSSSALSTKISGYDDGFALTCPVEKSWANKWGIYGVGGNVWECTRKLARDSSFDAWRGASWREGYEYYLRSTYRSNIDDASYRRGFNGFRLVLSP